MGNLAVSSLCSLPFQGSLALEGLAITSATLALLAGETELSSPHPLWVLFQAASLGNPGVLPFQGEAKGSRGGPCVLGHCGRLLSAFLLLCSPPSFFLS